MLDCVLERRISNDTLTEQGFCFAQARFRDETSTLCYGKMDESYEWFVMLVGFIE